MSTARRVAFVHDAAIDEYMAQILVQTGDGVDLECVVVVNADCLPASGLAGAWRMQQYIGRPDVPVGLSGARAWNPFPWDYRGDCVKENALPEMASISLPSWPPYPDGDAMLVKAMQTPGLTLLVTGPVTPVVDALKADPSLAANVAEVVIMGGAINVAGNLDPKTLPPSVANKYAEWNMFWDPAAADWLFRNTEFPIVLCPLDITGQAKITDDFRNRLGAQAKQFRVSRLAFDSYDLVKAESFYELWDVSTTAYLMRPDLFAPPTAMRLKVVVDGLEEGRVKAATDGREVDVVLDFADQAGFYDFVLQSFAF